MGVAAGTTFGLVNAVVGAETRVRSDQAGACNTLLEEECENLVVEEISLRRRVLVEVNRHFFGRSRKQHGCFSRGAAPAEPCFLLFYSEGRPAGH
jgi:hypothetical protein